MGELSIKVTIAGRTYPLTIKREEEESVRKAAKNINERIRSYEENYSVRDKQDLLAMCSLQLATQNLLLESKTVTEDSSLAETLAEMDSFVNDYLKIG
jgi:cell division protein ZapA (FtsZ GTPase activity inhibitor)